ncbi:MAG: 50S ribosomal protein L13 [Chloroflexi bacterium]|nr:50S ribosomal protein L13 [Chloroflexota bacterium]
MDKTYVVKADQTKEQWYVVDASGLTLGRVATRVAAALKGKHRPAYTPGTDLGDHVVIVNAERIVVSGKRLDEKFYYRVSGYPGGLRSESLRQMLDKHPDRVLTIAVKGMLPHNRYGRALLKKLKVYAGPDHPHAAQQPEPLPL